MKSALLLPFALLLGLVIGGWAPKSELSDAKRQVADLTAKLAERDKGSRFDAFTRMIKIPERAQAAPHAPAERRASAAAAQSAPQTAATNALTAPSAERRDAPADAEAAPAEAAERAPTPEDLRARIDEAKSLWQARVEIARAQWIERLRLDADQTAAFDTAVNAMNESLYASMQGLADTLASTDTLTPETGVRAFNEMTGALVGTYDALSAALPEEQRAEAAQLELTDFIDPAVAEPLVAVQDKLERLPPQRRPFGRPRR